MKKVLASILLVFYFAFSSGVVINLHYCMDRLDAFTLGASDTEVCGKCGMHTADASGCCHNDVKVIKIDDDQLASGINIKFSTPVVIDQHPDFFHETTLVQHTSIEFPDNHSPPLSRQNTYLRNCVFRI